MVYRTCGAACDGIKRTDQGGIIAGLLVKTSVKTQPPFFQDLDEIRLGACADQHAAAQTGVVVMMGTYIAWYQGLAAAVDHDIRIHVTSDSRFDCAYGAVSDDDIHILKNLNRFHCLHYADILYYSYCHGTSLTRHQPRRADKDKR